MNDGEAPSGLRRSPRRRRGALVVVALAIVAAGALIWFLAFREEPGIRPVEASGTVEATQAEIGFDMSGRIEEILVEEGDPVGDGDPVAVLDQAELRGRLRTARGEVGAARSRLAELERGTRIEEIDEARAAAAAQAEQLAQASREFDRTAQLFETGAVSREEYERAATAVDVAAAQLAQAAARLQRLESGPRPEEIAAQRGALEQARGRVQEVEALLDAGTLRAPFAGVVTVRNRTEGEVVAPGQPVVTVMDRTDRWVRIYIPEDQIGRIFLGQRARITSDTYEDEVYRGVVVFIADEAEFTPRNVQTEEERVKLVYAVNVQITHDPEFHLKPGIPADVVLEPRERS